MIPEARPGDFEFPQVFAVCVSSMISLPSAFPGNGGNPRSLSTLHVVSVVLHGVQDTQLGPDLIEYYLRPSQTSTGTAPLATYAI